MNFSLRLMAQSDEPQFQTMIASRLSLVYISLSLLTFAPSCQTLWRDFEKVFQPFIFFTGAEDVEAADYYFLFAGDCWMSHLVRSCAAL